MTKKSHQKSIVNKVATKRVLDQNTAAFKVYDTYKKTADINGFAKAKKFIKDEGPETLPAYIPLQIIMGPPQMQLQPRPQSQPRPKQ